MRLRVALALLAVVLLVTACSVTRGSGQLTTESRPVSGFTKVELSGTGELTIEKTGTESLSISAEDNLLPRLTSEVSNGTLSLGTEPNTTIVPTKPITYSLTVKDLNGLAVSGSGNIQVQNVTTAALSIEISGSGTITAGGAVNDQDLEISGSGRYQAEQLTSKIANVASPVVAARAFSRPRRWMSRSVAAERSPTAEIRRSNRRSAARES